MRKKTRIKKILKLIETYWNKNPDQRFGQLLINLGIADDSIRVWNNTDDALEEYLNLTINDSNSNDNQTIRKRK